MTIETATYIADLQPVNPPSTDPVSQGDDHIRLMKQVLQNTFTGGTRAFNIPGTFALSTSTTLLKTHGESTIYVSTAGGAATMTLPTLTALDAGWKCDFIKTTSDVNPMFIKPASGTINSGGISGLAQARRCIPAVRITAIWDGTNWFVTRALALPIASSIIFHGGALPAGFEWPNGQTLSSAANYPEYNSVWGSLVTVDLRGRLAVTLDNLGGVDANRLGATGSGFAGVRTSNGGAAGSPATTLGTPNLPSYTPSGGVSSSMGSISHNAGAAAAYSSSGADGPFAFPQGGAAATITPGAITSTFTGNAQGGTSTPFNNCQPGLMCSRILVVE